MMKKIRIDPDQAWVLAGLVAAMAIAVVANVYASSHFTRWDWTSSKRYTLSAPTLETLQALKEPVEIWVLLGGGDPMEQSVKQILVSYAAETRKLDIHYIDPDRDAPALDEVRRRFHVETGRTEDGRVVADAVMVVASKETSAQKQRRWFVSASDLIEVDEKDPKAKPREEQAITGAIRNVTREGDKSVLCFTTGHGERALNDGTEDGLGLFKDVLEKDNFETRTVDTTEPDNHEPFKGCSVAIIVPASVRTGTMTAFSDVELERLRTWLLAGGNLLLGIGPETDAPAAGMSRVLQPFGIALTPTWVLEGDPKFAFPDTRLNTFTTTVKQHPVTGSLAIDPDTRRPPPRVVMEMARPLQHVVGSDVAAADLLATSDQAFAVGFQRAAAIVRGNGDPVKEPGDTSGPFVIAMASERAKIGDAPHGPRVVVIGSASAFAATHWRQSAPWRGTAIFVENAIAWLASKPQVLDIPARPSVAAGIRVSEDSRNEVTRYVIVYMPLTVAVLGLAMAFVRRSTENKKKKRTDHDDESDS